MSFSEHCNQVFNQAIRDYHIKDKTEGLKFDDDEEF
mgnify:CR=1 FL=1